MQGLWQGLRLLGSGAIGTDKLCTIAMINHANSYGCFRYLISLKWFGCFIRIWDGRINDLQSCVDLLSFPRLFSGASSGRWAAGMARWKFPRQLMRSSWMPSSTAPRSDAPTPTESNPSRTRVTASGGVISKRHPYDAAIAAVE